MTENQLDGLNKQRDKISDITYAVDYFKGGYYSSQAGSPRLIIEFGEIGSFDINDLINKNWMDAGTIESVKSMTQQVIDLIALGLEKTLEKETKTFSDIQITGIVEE